MIFGILNQNGKPENEEKKTSKGSEIRSKNRFDDELKKSDLRNAYSVAESKLREKSYAERKFKTKENIISVRNFYPYVSVFLSLSVGILTGDLFASGLSDVGYYLTLGILTIAVFLVAWLLEDLKRDACQNLFEKPKAERTPEGRFWLNSLMLYSIIISGIGGYVASVHLNDRTDEIEQNYTVETDSIKTDYQSQILVVNSIINENMNRMKSGSKWVRYHAQKDLRKAQQDKTQLLELQNNTIANSENRKDKKLSENDSITKYKSYIIVLIVILFEVLYIRSFAYEYAVERKIKIENEKGRYVPSESPILDEPLTLQDVAMQLLLAQVFEGNGLQLPTNYQKTPTTPVKRPEIVGLKPNQNAVRTDTVRKDEKPQNVKECVQCGKEFVHKHWRAKYCSDACRVKAWEERNGRKFGTKIKKGGE